ncbi:MAG: GNAT family N-acetyltransferase [Planctomycetaceae bacterium]
MADFRIEPLDKRHDRLGFDCGSAPLNRYFSQQVGQDVKRRVTACFVAIEESTDQVAGYYTLSAGSVSLTDLPETTARKLPRYPTVPIVRIGRLAVALGFQGRKLGAALLFDALKRSMNADIACFAAVVDAKDTDAVRFYEWHGFHKLTSKSDVLFLPFSEALRRLADHGK